MDDQCTIVDDFSDIVNNNSERSQMKISASFPMNCLPTLFFAVSFFYVTFEHINGSFDSKLAAVNGKIVIS